MNLKNARPETILENFKAADTLLHTGVPLPNYLYVSHSEKDDIITMRKRTKNMFNSIEEKDEHGELVEWALSEVIENVQKEKMFLGKVQVNDKRHIKNPNDLDVVAKLHFIAELTRKGRDETELTVLKRGALVIGALYHLDSVRAQLDQLMHDISKEAVSNPDMLSQALQEMLRGLGKEPEPTH